MRNFCCAKTISTTIVSGDDDFHWSDCGGQTVRFNRLDFQPKPLILSKTKEIFVTGDFSIIEDLPTNVELIIVLNKTLHYQDEDSYNITIPCLDGTFGSCTIKLCDIFDTWLNDIICPFLKKNNRPCSCPIKAGNFSLENSRITVPFERFKGFLAQMASGDYNAKIMINNLDHFGPGENLLACLLLHARLAEN
ncbi:ganglioside GM2 activator-like isoform X2 [Dermatophagoides pteronyssinus]|uniref:Ganglioside GM2 activator-like isoform X2 n=1 Tax=Dermatophagoides pteronyssinus TaxID=6956 RepID=A0A6P6Y5Z9_DERPT|nr:ganglioside GM2 activator-like isoform X2 [Dermatophagoides pteronyssinus]